MTDPQVEVIADGLKALNNAAVELVGKGELEDAIKVITTAENTSRLFGYREGIGVAKFVLASIWMMKGEPVEAISHMDAAMEFLPPGEERDLAEEQGLKIALEVLKIGLEKRAEGDQEGTLEMFEKALPYLNEKRAEVISREIENLRSQLG